MSTLARRAFATGALKCKVLDFEGHLIHTRTVNRDDLVRVKAEAYALGYRVVPITEVSENIHEIMNTSRYGRE